MTWSLNEQRVCAVQASVLLDAMQGASAGNSSTHYTYADLMSVWQACVPHGMRVRDEYLYGIGVVHRATVPGRPDTVQYLSVETLGDDL